MARDARLDMRVRVRGIGSGSRDPDPSRGDSWRDGVASRGPSGACLLRQRVRASLSDLRILLGRCAADGTYDLAGRGNRCSGLFQRHARPRESFAHRQAQFVLEPWPNQL